MTHGYLVLPLARRIISFTFDTDADVCELLETGSVAHGTTLYSEDQLMVGDRTADGLPPGRFLVSGVPFTFAGNALLVGEDQPNGDSPTGLRCRSASFAIGSGSSPMPRSDGWWHWAPQMPATSDAASRAFGLRLPHVT